jgi:hypothetical protein
MPKKVTRQKRSKTSPKSLVRAYLKPALPDDVMAAAPRLAKPWLLAALRDGHGPADGVAVVVDVETPLGLEISIQREMKDGKSREQATLDLVAEIEQSRILGKHVIKSSWFDNDSFCRLCEGVLQPGDETWRRYVATPPPLGHVRLAVVVANAVRFCSTRFDVAGGN